jgi:methylmalonyl-CoA/ethylmalonyl-CoA epimerase
MELPLDHVAIAVHSIAESQPVFELLTGGGSTERERVGGQGVDVVFVGSGDSRLELLEATDPASPVARFLEKRGAGLHHLAYRVPDLEATLERLRAAGVELIDHTPRAGAGGHRVAFLHPRSCGGVLVELLEAAGRE